MRLARRHMHPPLVLALLLGGAAPVVAEEAPPEFEDETYETVVTPSRGEEAAFESPRAVEVVPRVKIRERLPSTSPAALENEVGVYMQRTNTGGGAPIIRGMLGQHVLLLIDGVRMNNAITRFGPNQLLNTVDPFQIQRVEIMRGPGSVLYGSDAIGGVINIITRKPAFDPRRAWDASAEFQGRFDSADTGLFGNLGLAGHLKSVGVRVGGSMKNFNDLVGGRDTGEQPFTSYWEGDADLSAAWAPSASSMLRLSYAAVRQHDAPRTDRSSPTDFRLFADQLRDLGTLSFTSEQDSFIKHVAATVSFHSQRELRERFRLEKDSIEREEDGVSTLGAQVALRSDLPRNKLTYGLDLYHDWVDSMAEQEKISTPTRIPSDRGRYVDQSRYLQLGVYALDRISFSRKLVVDLGARLNTWNIDIPEDRGGPAGSIDAIQLTRTGVVGSLHGRYLVGNGLNIVAGFSNSYRAPNVDDFSGLGCSGQGFDRPNSDLDPEHGLTAEAGVKFDLFGVLTGSFFYYFTHLFDQIVRMPGSMTTADGTVTKVMCGTNSAGQPMMANVYQRDNAKTSQIHGLELSARMSLGKSWSVYSWASWTRGQVTLDLPGNFSEPLGRTPPVNGLAGVRYDFDNRRGFIALSVRWAARQDRLSNSDRGDLRICPRGPAGCDGTPGYAVVSLRGAARLARPARLLLSVQNLTNETYRIHGSGVDGPGLSAIVGLELIIK